MNFIQLVFISVTRGLLEFLPISSTAHVIILQKLLGLPETDEFLTVVLKFAAILASIYFYRKKIIEILKNTFASLQKRNIEDLKKDKGVMIMIATIPSLIIAFFASKYLDILQNSTLIIAVNSIIFGILFYVIERYFSDKTPKTSLEKVSVQNLLVMGTVQGIAVAPGVSRSGSTVAAGLSQKIEMPDSIELSFLMGIPLLTIATGYEVVKYGHTFSSEMILFAAIGFVITFLFALLSIRLTLGWLTKYGFKPFMIYRVLFGVTLLVLLAFGILTS